MGKLISLQVLDIRNTKLEGLPNGFKQLSSLRELNMRENPQIQVFPEFVEYCLNLERLDFNSCSLTKLPRNMGQLSKLTTLDIRKNQLTSFAIPPSIRDLSNLNRLYIRCEERKEREMS